MSKIVISEPVFKSIQGEGNLSGRLSLWIRFFGCNLQCNGFMQDDPTSPETYQLPQFTLKNVNFKSALDLPVFERGCDSGYSWSPYFKHLALTYPTVDEFYQKEIEPFLWGGDWKHPITENVMDLCFTGGEPMLWQKQLIEVAKHVQLKAKTTTSIMIQIETNGTKRITKEFLNWIINDRRDMSLNWNISPKLFNVSGENSSVAWNVDAIREYWNINPVGHLKFVVNGTNATWKELEERVSELKKNKIGFPIFVMPVGATKEQQEDVDHVGKIATEAVNRGYHVSGRTHAILWGNSAGV